VTLIYSEQCSSSNNNNNNNNNNKNKKTFGKLYPAVGFDFAETLQWVYKFRNKYTYLGVTYVHGTIYLTPAAI
jgi:hypothetical protein